MPKQKLGRVHTTTLYRKLLVGFCVVVVLLFGLVVYYSLSKTVITVRLEPQATSVTFDAAVVDAETAQTMSTNLVLVGKVVQVELTKTSTFTNANEGEAVPAQATGTVTIYNNWSKEQPLAATTRLLSPDGVMFRLKERVDVPAGGKVENVAVYADQPGADGNIGPTKFTIPGLWAGLQDDIYAESAAPMINGMVSKAVITKELINEARKKIMADLIPEAVAAIEQEHSVTLPDAPYLHAETADYSTDPAEGEEGAAFNLTVTGRFVATIVDDQNLTALGQSLLKSQLEDTLESVNSPQPSASYTITGYDLAKNHAQIKAIYTAYATPRLSHPMFERTPLLGQDTQTIKAHFSNFDEVAGVEVSYSPFWMRHASSVADHIEIKLSQG